MQNRQSRAVRFAVSVPALPEEVDAVLPEAYRTADFEFVAFALAYGKPKVEVVGMIPFDDTSRWGGVPSKKFVFLLLATEEGVNTKEALSILSQNYVNGRTLIEPTLLAAKRNRLRSYIRNMVEHGSSKKG